MSRRAIIVGGGIGGLSAAIAFGLRGWDVRVLEQAPELTEVGAGLQISPNGTRVLDALRVLDRLKPVLFEPETVELRLGRSGRQVFSIPMQRIAKARWGAGYYQVHRADLVEALRERLEEIRPGAIQTGSHVSGYLQADGQISAVLGPQETEGADLLIGADGLRSTIREQMLGPQTPRFTSNVAWRAVVPVERLGEDAPPPAGCIWAGSGRHAVTTYLRAGSLVNFVGIVEQTDWREEGWHHEGNAKEALAEFDGWHPVIRRILENSDQIHRWALFDRPPLSRWSDGRAVLLGDACHPMLPSMAQGAVQALEDSWHLAAVMDRIPDVAEAAHRYYSDRIARVTAVQERSATNARLFHLRTGALRFAAYAPLWAASRILPRVLCGMQDRIYAHDVTQNADLPMG